MSVNCMFRVNFESIIDRSSAESINYVEPRGLVELFLNDVSQGIRVSRWYNDRVYYWDSDLNISSVVTCGIGWILIDGGVRDSENSGDWKIGREMLG